MLAAPSNHTGYVPGNSPSDSASAAGVDHAGLKKKFLAYLDNKSEEIREQQDARRYYHGSQYTNQQIKILNKRKQPVVTYNRIKRKINAIVGMLAKQQQDPRGYPRTPKHEEGADVATAVLRYVCDEQDWPAKNLIAGTNGAVDGLGGVEIVLEQGDVGDVEIGLEEVDPSSFFYDPRSLKMDFSDARYMGVGKWADLDALIMLFPDKEDELRDSVNSGSELTSNPDSDNKWFANSETGNRIRVIDHWYMVGNEWRWCIYTGAVVLDQGVSYLKDEKNRSICKYVMYSANIDQDGDRYGFFRDMKSSQDEINQRRSKGLHNLNSRRLILPSNDGHDIEATRREAARPDGVITYPQGSAEPKFDDAAKSAELQGQLAFLADAKDEIENFGINPALIGQGVQDMSGKAIQLQQQAGIAELGPYLISIKNWKLRTYRAIWCAVQQHWSSERWIRVTDDDQVAQFFAVNQLSVDPMTGMPTIVNALGSLDVDIIIDEGPDTVNIQQDVYNTLTQLAANKVPVPPELIIEASPLPGQAKQKMLGILEKSQQSQQGPQQIQQAGAMAEIKDKQAATTLKLAQAQKFLADANAEGGQTDQVVQPLEVEHSVADLRQKDAQTAKTLADAHKTNVDAVLAPIQAANEAARTKQQAQAASHGSRHPA